MNQNDPPTEHILACLSSSPSNAKIVRTAATMAKAFGGTFTALYVRTPDSDQMGKEDSSALAAAHSYGRAGRCRHFYDLRG
ncbi:MAG: universal stress protein [Faecalibacterium sp.]